MSEFSQANRAFGSSETAQGYQFQPQAGAIASIPPQEPDLMRWRNGIGHLADRAADLVHALGNFGDELFGTEPAPAPLTKERGDPHCQVAAMDAQIQRLEANLADAERMFQRLRRLA